MSDTKNSSQPDSSLESVQSSRHKPQFEPSGTSSRRSVGKGAARSPVLIGAAVAFAALAIGVLGWSTFSKKADGVERSASQGSGLLDFGDGGNVAQPATVATAASAPKSPAESIRDLVSEVKGVAGAVTELINGQRQTNEALSRLEGEVLAMRTDIDEMKVKQTQPAAHPATYRPRVRKAAPKPAQVASAPESKTELLGVDVWNGRPSVAVKTGVPGDAKVRFLHEGDTTPNAYVQKADADDQRVVFGLVGGQQVVLTKDRE